MNIHEAIAEKVELAGIYARDGAFHSAARCLTQAADIAKAHAVWIDEELDKLVANGTVKIVSVPLEDLKLAAPAAEDGAPANDA